MIAAKKRKSRKKELTGDPNGIRAAKRKLAEYVS